MHERKQRKIYLADFILTLMATSHQSTTSTHDQKEVDMVDLVIFDLDNTLALTGDMEEFRGKKHLNAQSEEYKNSVKFALGMKKRDLLSAGFFQGIRDGFPKVKFAVFTKSPREYASLVLSEVYPTIHWSSIVAFEDVGRTKPSPEGIELAMKACGVANRQSVIMVGDDVDDIDAAYRAGVRVILAELHGGNTNYAARDRIPDASVMVERTLLGAILDVRDRLPCMERLVEGVTLPQDKGRVCRTSHWPPKEVETVRTPLVVYSLGRLFAEYAQLKPRREWHVLTDEIIKYKDTDNFPVEWAGLVRDVISEMISAHHKATTKEILSTKRYEIVITCAPSKKGRLPRMENFIQLIGNVCAERPLVRSKHEVVISAFKFSEAAKSHHGEHLNAMQRYENVRDCLSMSENSNVKDKLVFLIDDVVTTGATLYYMDKYCNKAGATKVICLSLAHTISVSRD